MTKFKSKSEVEKQLPSKTKTHYAGEIYPEIFSHINSSELNDQMPLDAALIWLGSYRLKSGLFQKEICPICKINTLIPYMCGGSVLSGAHTIQFYCTNCHEQFVTNDNIEYFRQIYRFVMDNINELEPSPKFSNCTKIKGGTYVHNKNN